MQVFLSKECHGKKLPISVGPTKPSASLREIPRMLTLVDLQEGFRELVRHEGLRKVSKILLQHVCHIVSGLAFIIDVVFGAFVHLA